MWQPGLAIVDFTNPAACEWYGKKLEALLDMGVDCFKTDFGERIPTDCVYYDGSDPVKMHNYYTYMYNKTVHDVIAKKRARKKRFFLRAPQRRAVRNSRCTGAVTAGRIMSQWRRVCGAVCR